MTLPNFFIIGAPKCGTTSLANWLAEHPQIYFSPIKEPFYFSKDVNKSKYSWNEYVNLFSEAKNNHLATGEGSTTYLFSSIAVKTIEETIENPRYIVMLRNPVEMAYSLHEQHVYALNEEIEDFEKAWRLSPERRAGLKVPKHCSSPILLDYQNFCLLGEQVERLYSIVPQERVLILLLDDFKVDAKREYLRTLRFISVPDDGRNQFPVYNSAKQWRAKWQGKIVRSFANVVSFLKYKKKILPKQSFGFIELLKNKTLNVSPRSPINENFTEELRKFYELDVKKLSLLIKRDLLDLWDYNQYNLL